MCFDTKFDPITLMKVNFDQFLARKFKIFEYESKIFGQKMNIWNSVMVKGKETFTLFQRLERLWWHTIFWVWKAQDL